MTHPSQFVMKAPCYAMLCDYPQGCFNWEFCQTDKELNYILTALLGDPAKGYQWDEYYPTKYEDTYVVDSDELVVVRHTLAECVDAAYRTTKDLCLARYVDSVGSEETLHNTAFRWYYQTFKQELDEVFNSREFAQPSLKEFISTTN